MWFIIYFLIAFVVLFFQWKKRSPAMFEYLDRYQSWMDSLEFWKIIGTTIFFPIALPLGLLWKLLERLTKL